MPRPWSVRRPRVDGKVTLPALADHLAAILCPPRSLEEMVVFSDTVLEESGKALGWSGGSCVSRIGPREQTVRCHIALLRQLASAVHMLSLSPTLPNRSRWEQIFVFLRDRLHFFRVIPSSVFSLEEMRNWLDGSLSRVIANLRLNALELSTTRSFSQAERDLFLDPSSRTRWLQMIGLKTTLSAAPRVIRRSDGSVVSSPEDIRGAYLDKLSPILRHPLELPNSSSDPIEIQLPDLPNRDSKEQVASRAFARPHWWHAAYSRSAKGIHEEIWLPLMAPVTEKEICDTILTAWTSKVTLATCLKLCFFLTVLCFPILRD